MVTATARSTTEKRDNQMHQAFRTFQSLLLTQESGISSAALEQTPSIRGRPCLSTERPQNGQTL